MPLTWSLRRQTGVRKPHPRIFSLVLERCGVDADAAVLVGDSWHADVEGARDAGLVSFSCAGGALLHHDQLRPLAHGIGRISDLRAAVALSSLGRALERMATTRLV